MKLKEWRNARGLSQHAAGQGLGWSQSKFQRIEAGDQPADADDLRALHDYTGGAVTPNDMVFGERAAGAAIGAE